MMTKFSSKHFFTATVIALVMAACSTPEPAKVSAKVDAPRQTDFPDLALAQNNALLVFFVETLRRDPLQSFPVSWVRGNPREAWIERKPVFDPMPHLDRAEVLRDPDGTCRVALRMNERGTHLLDMTTGEHKGQRLFLLAVFRGKDGKELHRCVGTYPVRQNNPTGLVVFTPDSTPEDAESLVGGLNKARKAINP